MFYTLHFKSIILNKDAYDEFHLCLRMMHLKMMYALYLDLHLCWLKFLCVTFPNDDKIISSIGMYPIKGDEQACITRGIRNTIICLFDIHSFHCMCVCFISMTNSFSIILNNCDDTFYSVCILREKKTFT